MYVCAYDDDALISQLLFVPSFWQIHLFHLWHMLTKSKFPLMADYHFRRPLRCHCSHAFVRIYRAAWRQCSCMQQCACRYWYFRRWRHDRRSACEASTRGLKAWPRSFMTRWWHMKHERGFRLLQGWRHVASKLDHVVSWLGGGTWKHSRDVWGVWPCGFVTRWWHVKHDMSVMSRGLEAWLCDAVTGWWHVRHEREVSWRLTVQGVTMRFHDCVAAVWWHVRHERQVAWCVKRGWMVLWYDYDYSTGNMVIHIPCSTFLSNCCLINLWFSPLT